MAHEELKHQVPNGQLYRIVMGEFSKFVAVINTKNVFFSCKETVFLILDITCKGQYHNITALFPSGQVGLISYMLKNEIELL